MPSTYKEQENSVYGSNRRAHIHDSKMLPKLVEDILRTNGCSMIDKLIADGAYDSNDIFRCLSEKGIIPCIKVRKNSRVRKTGHLFRNLSVIAQRNNYEQWKDSVSYGQRWIVETVFSSLKRMFGICLFCQIEKHETGIDVKSITI